MLLCADTRESSTRGELSLRHNLRAKNHKRSQRERRRANLEHCKNSACFGKLLNFVFINLLLLFFFLNRVPRAKTMIVSTQTSRLVSFSFLIR